MRLLLLCSLVACAASALQAQRPLTKDDLPAPVRAAFADAYPSAAITGVDREREGGTTLYEVESTDGDRRRNLLYTADGKVTEIEEEIPVDSLPKAVRRAIEKAAPGREIDEAERVTRGKTITYEVGVELGKRIMEYVIEPSGRVVRSAFVSDEDRRKAAGNESEEEEEEEEDDL